MSFACFGNWSRRPNREAIGRSQVSVKDVGEDTLISLRSARYNDFHMKMAGV